jgi:ribose transport system permease protein
MTLLAYVICSTLAGLGGILFVLDINAAQPSDFGNFYELYAIAAPCSAAVHSAAAKAASAAW